MKGPEEKCAGPAESKLDKFHYLTYGGRKS